MEIHGRSWNLLEHSMIFSTQIVYNKLTPISKEERPPPPFETPPIELYPTFTTPILPLSLPSVSTLTLTLRTVWLSDSLVSQ